MRKPFHLDARATVSFLLGVGAALLLVTLVYLRLNVADGESSNFFVLRSHSPRLNFRPIPCGSAGQPPCSKILTGRFLPSEFGLEQDPSEWLETTEKDKAGEREYGEYHKPLIPLGLSSFLFIHVSAHRTGPSSFAVVGLGAKQLFTSFDSHPDFRCSWVQNAPSDSTFSLSEDSTATKGSRDVEGTLTINGTATKYTSDDASFQDSTEYITLVIHCNFDFPVGVGREGGALNLVAEQGRRHNDLGFNDVEFVALEERAGEYNGARFVEPFKYEYLYCGAPMYGTMNAQRVREWMAYHMRLFGSSSHFILYDAGGMSDDVYRVLEPWVKLGRVTINNARPARHFSVFNLSLFMYINDCLIRARTLAKWTFFFDLDEYIHVADKPHLEESFHKAMAELHTRGRRATAVRIQQWPFVQGYCSPPDNDHRKGSNESDWAIERLVYRRMPPEHWPEWNHWRDPKSIIQAKYVLVMGVHWPVTVELTDGMGQFDTTTMLEDNPNDPENSLGVKINYYHYRGTASSTQDLCQHVLDPSNTTFEFDSAVYKYDDSMCSMAEIVKAFERNAIGSRF